ncbi:MAG: group III truncated hemoglobin [Chitinophagaceae bacterium]|nr:group III truncated hemoglobin [Chitinophagaceae bacterium]
MIEQDIESRADIETLLQQFYGKALTDPVIGYFFTEVVPLNITTHIPVIADFWETILFGKAAYKGDAMKVHRQIHQLSAFRDEHFKRWVELFQGTVNELFAGPKAELAKQRAESIATLMRIKTVHGALHRSNKII